MKKRDLPDMPLEWPKHGIAYDQAHGRQRPHTTPKAQNVRSVDPESDRVQGGQRAGYSNFTSQPLESGKPVSALQGVVVDQPKFSFRGPNSSTLQTKWTAVTPSRWAAVGVDVDIYGAVYVVDSDGAFQKYGADGGLLQTVTVPLYPAESMVPRIQVDRDRNVYLVSTSAANHGRVFRYRPLEEDRYALAWTLPVTYAVADFKVQSDILYLAIKRGYSNYGLRGGVSMYTGLKLTSPDKAFEIGLPHPIRGISINDSGDCLVAIGSYGSRGELTGSTTWQDPTVLWSPHALEDISGYGASSRIHLWLDATADATIETSGTTVYAARDRRWLHTNAGPEDVPTAEVTEGNAASVFLADGSHSFTSVYDKYPRPGYTFTGMGLYYTPYGPDLHKEGPTFESTGAGPNPSWRFNKDAEHSRVDEYLGQIGDRNNRGNLIALTAPSDNNKEDTDGDTYPNKEGELIGGGLAPGHETATWTICMVIRYTIADKAQVVLAQPGNTTGWSYPTNAGWVLLMNADERTIYSTATNLGAAGKLCLGMNGVTSSHTGADNEVISADLASSPYKNSRGVAIVTIHCGGAGNADKSLFRVNGYTVDRFTMNTTVCHPPGEHDPGKLMNANIGAFDHWMGVDIAESWLAMGPAMYPYQTGGINEPEPPDSFDGHLCEIITMLGSTSTETQPNEDPLTFPGEPAGATTPAAPGASLQWTDMTGYTYGTTAQKIAYTQFASEIEQLEGYLAHKWGCHDLLDATSGTPSGGFDAGHPFRTGYPPVGPAGTSGVDPTDLQTALASKEDICCKVSQSGHVTWAISGAGHGSAVASGNDDYVYAVGHNWQDKTNLVAAKKFKDLGPSVDELDGWTFESDTRIGLTSHHKDLKVDGHGHMYWPRDASASMTIYAIEQSGQPANGDYVSIGFGGDPSDRVYQFTTTSPPPSMSGVIVYVLIGASATATWKHLYYAIRGIGDPGTDYSDDAERYEHAYGAWKVEYTKLEIIARNAGTTANKINVGLNVGRTNFDFEGAGSSLDVQSLAGGRDFELAVHDSDTGEVLYTHATGSSGPYGAWYIGVAFDPDAPAYNDEDLTGVPENLYLAARNDTRDDDWDGTTVGPTLVKMSQIARTQSIGRNMSPRKDVYLGICNGSLYKLVKGKAPELVTGGSEILQADSPWTSMFTYRSKVYMMDGLSYYVYDPVTEEVTEWTATKGGQIPYGAKLAAVWNGRIVLARTPDDPHNLHMSYRGDPDNWDVDPLVVTPLTAFTGSGSGTNTFKKQDLVTCLIPASDDLLIVGGQGSIHRLTGDPGGQGQLDLVTDSEGLAFGAPWCKDPSGNVYVKGSQGGIYQLSRDGSARSITQDSIESAIRAVNLKEYDIVMGWNFDLGGLHVFQVPKGDNTGVTVDHWFWDSKEDGWWLDRFSDPSLEPTCVAVFDGDEADDRVLVIGCADGYVRYEDSTAVSDAGHPIESFCMIGPLVPQEMSNQVMFSHLRVQLASRYNGCTAAVYVSDVADYNGGPEPVAEAYQDPGWNGYTMFRAKGNQAWVELRNATLDQKWALEGLSVKADKKGRKR